MTNLARFLNHNEFEPWDIMFKDLFNTNSFFLPVLDAKPSYPTDVYEDDKQVTIEVAAVGLEKDDISIEEQDGLLTVSYNKKEEYNNDKCNCIQRGITRKAFNLSYKFSDKFDLENIDAQLDKGILKISVPKHEEKPALPKNKIQIK